MRRFSTDPSCTRKEALRDGRKLRALEIQRHYLEAAEAHVSRDFMPPWAGEVCAEWRRMLDRLEGGEGAVSTILDWGIKLILFKEHARKHGLKWDKLSRWAPPVEPIAATPGRPEPRPVPLDTNESIGDRRLSEEQMRLFDLRESREPESEELRSFLRLRAELFELDTKFGELGPRGIFSALDEAGVLDHRLQRLGDVEQAIDQPPAGGRAHARGQAVLRHCGERGRYTASWQEILDHQLGRTLDLSDPFGRNPPWATPASATKQSREEHLLRMIRERRAR
jgi:hypothetical protein